MKKILILITKAEIGGAQMSVLGLAKGLTDSGFAVDVGCGSDGFLRGQLSGSGIGFHLFKHLKRSHNPLAMAGLVSEVRGFVKARGYDAVILNSYNTLPAAMGAKRSGRGVKTIMVFRGLSMLDRGYEAPAWLKTAYRQFFRFFLRYVDEPVFVCQANLETALSEKIVRHGRVIYNGIGERADSFLDPVSARTDMSRRLNADLAGKTVIGSIGRLAYPKNFEFLISAMPLLAERLPGAVLIIVGGGPDEDKYRGMIAERGLGDRVLLAGSVDGASRLIKAFDAFVLPSKFEGLSITLLEALSAGVPILASRVGGTPEIVGGTEEQLYDTDGKDEFLEKLHALVTDKSLRERIIANNLDQSKEFKIEDTVKKYAEMIGK